MQVIGYLRLQNKPEFGIFYCFRRQNYLYKKTSSHTNWTCIWFHVWFRNVLGHVTPSGVPYLARSFRSSRPSLFLSNIFIWKGGKRRKEKENWYISLIQWSGSHHHQHPVACYHGDGVLLQFLGTDGLPVLDEQVLKEALQGQTQTGQ